MDTTEPRTYRIADAARLLQMSPSTLWRRVRQGRVTLPRVDGRLVVPASRLADLATDPTVAARRYRRRTSRGARR